MIIVPACPVINNQGGATGHISYQQLTHYNSQTPVEPFHRVIANRRP